MCTSLSVISVACEGFANGTSVPSRSHNFETPISTTMRLIIDWLTGNFPERHFERFDGSMPKCLANWACVMRENLMRYFIRSMTVDVGS